MKEESYIDGFLYGCLTTNQLWMCFGVNDMVFQTSRREIRGI